MGTGTWLATVAILAALTVTLLATAPVTHAADDAGGPTWAQSDAAPAAFASLATVELDRPTLAWSGTGLRSEPSPQPIQWVIWGCIKLGVCQILLDAPLEGVVITRAQVYGL